MTAIQRKFIFIIFLFQAIGLTAQHVKVKWGATISDEKHTGFNIIGEDDIAVYVLRFQPDKKNLSVPFFESLNRNTLQVIKSVEMEIPIPAEGDASMRDVYFLKDKFVMMITLTSTAEKKVSVLAYTMDKNGKILPNYKSILEHDLPNKYLADDYRFLISPDSTRFMAVVYSNNGKGHNYKAAAFDSDLNGIWVADFSLDDEIKKTSIVPNAYAMDMNGDFFIVAKASSKNIYTNEPANKFCVYKGKEKQLKTFDILPPDGLVAYETGQFLSDVDGNTWYTSMYGEKDTDAKGVAISKYKNGLCESFFKPFSDRFRSAFMSDSKAAKGGPVDYLVIDDVILNKDKSFEVIMHKYAPREFVAAVAIKFDPDLREAWSAPLPIYFWYSGDYFYFNTMLTDKELCFIYNDNKKNMETVDPREASGLSDIDNAVCVILRVDLQTGKVKKEALTGTEETYLIPRKCYQSSETEMLLFARKKANVNFGKLTIE